MCQFNLAYLAHIDVSTTDEMSVAEFNNFHEILMKQKKYEKEEQEKAIARAQANKKR